MDMNLYLLYPFSCISPPLANFRIKCGLVWLSCTLHLIKEDKKETKKMLMAEIIHLKLLLIGDIYIDQETGTSFWQMPIEMAEISLA